MRGFSILALYVFMSGAVSYAQSPALKCLAVDAAGNVQVTWVPPSDSCGVFNQYYIYYSPTVGGPFSLIDSVAGFSVTTYYHVGANANASTAVYYIETSSGCATVPTDTLETILLSVSNSFGGTADLLWSDLHTPTVPTNTGMYQVFREDTITGVLQYLDSVSLQFTYSDPFTTCLDSAGYQIVMTDSSGCISTSNIALLEPDIISPPMVIIDSASIDTSTGEIIIGWQPSSAVDVIGYVITIYNVLNQGFDDVDTVYGTTTYLDVFSNLNISDSMFVYAIDACGNVGSPITGHSVIELTGSLDTCLGEATLTWTPYFEWSTGVADYDVFVSQNGGPFNYEGTAAGTQYVYTGLIQGTSYCYFVRANDGLGNKTSSSNVMCTYDDTLSAGAIPFSLTVEARDSIKNLLVWNEDPSWAALVGFYQIYRSFDGGSYSLVTTVPFGTSMYEDLLDPVSSFTSGSGDFCYFVVPIKIAPNLYGCIDTSNTDCVTQFPKFVVANTFTPNGDGRNDYFKPIRAFVRADGYLLIIYNRWGQKLFETTDINEGWDGLIKGFAGQNDAYVYYVTFTIGDGIPIQRAGTVLLIR